MKEYIISDNVRNKLKTPLGKLIENKRIHVKPYITHSFPLREYQKAHDVFVAREDGALLVNLYPGT